MTRLAALAWTYLWARPLVTALNLVLLSLGLGAVTFVLLAGEQVDHNLRRDVAGIDLVVGAKGSPMQIMLAGIYHLDVPTGNIPLDTVKAVAGHALVERAVPLSLGDSVRGHRIVGTTPDYPALFEASLAQGRWWTPGRRPLEVVLGARAAQDLGLGLGATFVGTHGLGTDGDGHGDSPYVVVGLLEPTQSVLDRLVLTATESVWAVHAHAHEADGDAPDAHDDAQEAREVTMVLVRYRSPLAAAVLPRWINGQAGLQSASPALESARLLRMVGLGVDVLRGFGAVLLLASALSVFVALFHAVREREGDLAMMRMLGAPPRRIGALVAFEAIWLAVLGAAAGLALGHGLTAALGAGLAAEQSLALTGAWFSPWEVAVPVLALVLALAACAWPVWRAYRLDVTTLLHAPP